MIEKCQTSNGMINDLNCGFQLNNLVRIIIRSENSSDELILIVISEAAE